ncbi:universal stress protein [Bacteroidota bacterium]
MYDIKNFLITLDMSEIDESMVEYASMVVDKLDLDKICFLHVVKPIDLPEELIHDYPELDDVIHSTIKSKIEDLIKRFFTGAPDSFEILLKEGNPDKVVLETARDLDIDVIAMGMKDGLEGVGTLSHKIAKLAPCTVVFIPEVLPRKLEKILVPTDFSVHSKMAAQVAAKISSKNDKAGIFCQHVYNVPSGYSKIGKTYEEFADIMKSNGVKMFDAYNNSEELKDIPIDICEFTLNNHGRIHEYIYMHAIKMRADMIVIGSKGRTEASSLLLGSTADKLLNYNNQLPIIVVKEKNHNLDFLHALLSL